MLSLGLVRAHRETTPRPWETETGDWESRPAWVPELSRFGTPFLPLTPEEETPFPYRIKSPVFFGGPFSLAGRPIFYEPKFGGRRHA